MRPADSARADLVARRDHHAQPGQVLVHHQHGARLLSKDRAVLAMHKHLVGLGVAVAARYEIAAG